MRSLGMRAYLSAVSLFVSSLLARSRASRPRRAFGRLAALGPSRPLVGRPASARGAGAVCSGFASLFYSPSIRSSPTFYKV